MTQAHTVTTQPPTTDVIEVTDEIDRVVYVFLASTSSAAQLVEDWATSGDPTFAFTRPASDDDLANASAALAGSTTP